jgi:two-component system LytT family response regulator
MIRALIVDSDSSARLVLKAQLALEPDVEIVGETGDGPRIADWVAGTQPDVVFGDMDVDQLPALEAKLVRNLGRRPYVIITACDDRQALRAFDASVTDFLLKPLNPQRVKGAIMRIRRNVDRDLRLAQRLDMGELVNQGKSPSEPSMAERMGNRIPVKFGRRYRFMNMSAMLYVEARGDYADIHMMTGELVHSSDRISGIERRFPSERFLRVHRSFIINLEHVKEVRITDKDYLIVMQDDRTFRPGNTYRTRVKRLLIDSRKAQESPFARPVESRFSSQQR